MLSISSEHANTRNEKHVRARALMLNLRTPVIDGLAGIKKTVCCQGVRPSVITLWHSVYSGSQLGALSCAKLSIFGHFFGCFQSPDGVEVVP